MQKRSNGTEITYTVAEVGADANGNYQNGEYKVSYSSKDNTFTITNSHSAKTTEYTVTKSWETRLMESVNLTD